jgi:multiple sugar transport system substrate-binding protein
MKEMDRRTFVKLGLAGVAGTALVPAWIEKLLADPNEAAKWRQFEGETVKVLTENTPPSLGIKATAEEFTKLTGMKAEFTLHAMDELKEKMFLDLRSGHPEYIVNYCQCRPIGCVACDFWQPVDKFIDLKTGKSKIKELPDVPDANGDLFGSWQPMFFNACSIYYEPERVISLPYDHAQGIMFYRQDIFDKYGPKYQDKTGKPMKLGEEVTWDEVFDMCKFLKANCTEIDAPLGLHYAQDWPIVSEFNSTLTGLGVPREGFANIKDPFLGSRNPGPFFAKKEEYHKGVEALEFLKKLKEIMHPDVLTWDWGGLGTAYSTGKLVIQRNCGEFAPFVEDPKESQACGKTSYAVVPKFHTGIHGYEMGPAGLAVPKVLPEKEQRKAWLFILWATSAKAQWGAFEQFYGTPVRTANLEEARKRGWMTPDSTFRKAQHLWVQEIELAKYLNGWDVGPKMPTYNEYLALAGAEISKYVAGVTPKPQTCMDNMIAKVNKLHGL